MPTNIRIRRGKKANLPKSAPSGMPLWCEDTKELYIGTGTGVQIIHTYDADTVDGYHASSLVKFYLSPMTSGAPADSAKDWFINTMPYASGAIVYNVPGSEKTIIAGKSSG